MRPRALLFVTFLFMSATFVFTLAAASVEMFPVSEVRPGMTGIGRTVFEGSRIDEFKVQILGILENVGPKQSMILARLEGGPLAETGVIAGMSGSPVFIDGKLLGAVAYGFPFSKETIAGITPIGEMIEATRLETPRAASARFKPSLSPGPLDRDAMMATLRRPMPAVSATLPSFPGQKENLVLSPLALPLVFSGFDPTTFEWARGAFGALGFSPIWGTGHGPDPGNTLPDLKPGGALGVTLIEGDMDLSVTGTITHIDQDRVYAFGHPFYNLGPTQFPMKKAYVYSVFPSIYQSWKISTARESVGTIEQDRVAAISGRLGKTPRMIPVHVNLSTSRSQERSFSFRIVEDELLTPALAYVSLLSILQANERAFGTSTMQVEGHLSCSGGRDIRVEDVFTQNEPANQSAALVAAPLAYLMSNDFEPVHVEKLEVNVSSLETIQSATLERAWLARTGAVHPGTTIPLNLVLRTYRGETVKEMIPVSVPKSAPPGNYHLLVGDAEALTSLDQREMRQPFAPKDLDQLVRAINNLRHKSHLYARLLRPDDGVIVAGEYLQSLPPSILAVIGTKDQGSNVIPIRTATVWEFDLTTEYTVTGSRSLPLTIER